MAIKAKTGIAFPASVANNGIMKKNSLPSLFVLPVLLLAAAATVQARNLDIKWIEVEGGAFTPASGGSTRPITLDGFFMSATEVTFDQFDAYCEATGARKPDDAGWGRGSRPVLNVSWEEAAAFCRWLSREIGAEIRLPNEAEWEYAAAGGNRSKGYRYSGSNTWREVSWSEGNSGGMPHPVGGKKPNELGLYDMSGNLWEMCADWPAGDPAKPRSASGSRDKGVKRAVHGNSYDNPASDPRRADVHVFLGEGHINVGFRVVKTI